MQAIFRGNVCVDANHQLHITVPAGMGDEFEVIVMPLQAQLAKDVLSDDEQFMLAAYSAAVEHDPEEDAIWEKYVK